jgi:hypothetical protein
VRLTSTHSPHDSFGSGPKCLGSSLGRRACSTIISTSPSSLDGILTGFQAGSSSDDASPWSGNGAVSSFSQSRMGRGTESAVRAYRVIASWRRWAAASSASVGAGSSSPR